MSSGKEDGCKGIRVHEEKSVDLVKISELVDQSKTEASEAFGTLLQHVKTLKAFKLAREIIAEHIVIVNTPTDMRRNLKLHQYKEVVQHWNRLKEEKDRLNFMKRRHMETASPGGDARVTPQPRKIQRAANVDSILDSVERQADSILDELRLVLREALADPAGTIQQVLQPLISSCLFAAFPALLAPVALWFRASCFRAAVLTFISLPNPLFSAARSHRSAPNRRARRAASGRLDDQVDSSR